MPVNSLHPAYTTELPRITAVRDAVDGNLWQRRVAEKYLAEFDPPDENKMKLLHKLGYYMNVSGRTLDALNGMVFRRDPSYELPQPIEYMLENCDGKGTSLRSFAGEVIDEALQTVRCGILTDYPSAPEGLTKEQVKALELQPYFAFYPFESIINWRHTVVAGKTILSMVVLKEIGSESVDEFEDRPVDRYRVLLINENGVYEQRVYDEKLEMISATIPRDASGKPFNRIPFEMITRKTPVLWPLVEVNLAHYRNTCDGEYSLRIFSQVGLHIDTGEMSADAWKTLNPNGVTFGAGAAITTSGGGSVSVLQAAPHDKLTSAIERKEQQMVAVGGRIIDRAGAQQTAEEARINASSDNSVLNQVVCEVEDAIEAALEWAALFTFAEPGKVQYSLNREFFDTRLDPQTIMATIQLADRGDIAQSDVRDMLRRGGMLSDARTDDAIDEDIADTGV